MSARVSSDPKKILVENLKTLKVYAERSIVRGEALTSHEDEDRVRRIREFMGIGTSFGCTQKELVKLLLKEYLEVKRGCDCITCTSRKASQQKITSA